MVLNRITLNKTYISQSFNLKQREDTPTHRKYHMREDGKRDERMEQDMIAAERERVERCCLERRGTDMRDEMRGWDRT